MEQGQYRSYRAVHPFDERFGVETSGLIYQLPSGHHHDVHNNGYFAVAPSVFHAVMGSLKERLHLDYRRFTFVDVGSGKGRALLLASDYPFREIIGVELSPDLDRVARSNIARYPSAARVDVYPGRCGRVPLARRAVDYLHVELVYAAGDGARFPEPGSLADGTATRDLPGVHTPRVGVHAF